MACMEHECLICGWAEFDNTRTGHGCPVHGHERMAHHFDEQPDYERDDYEEDERDEE